MICYAGDTFNITNQGTLPLVFPLCNFELTSVNLAKVSVSSATVLRCRLSAIYTTRVRFRSKLVQALTKYEM